MGVCIYISEKEYEAIFDGLDTLETNCEHAGEEYVKETEPHILALHNIMKKYIKAKVRQES